jgi:hypothetical protein
MKNYKYILVLSTIKIIARVISMVASVIVAALVSPVLAIILGASLVLNEILNFVVAKELDRIQQAATDNLMNQLQEELVLNPSQENWN